MSYNKIFLGYQPRQLVKIRRHRRFKGHHCPCPQGSEVVENSQPCHICTCSAPCTWLRASQWGLQNPEDEGSDGP
jgi:hypothetical protein